MKTKFLIIGALVLIAIALSGCFWQEEKEPAIPEMNSDAALDNKLFSDAVKQKNSDLCLKIKNKDPKEECVNSVQGLLSIDEAIKKTDAALCKKIKLERYKTTCETLVNEKSEKEKEEKQQSGKVQKALDAQDASLCDAIKDNEAKYTCKYNILVNKAEQNKDASMCDGIGFPEYIEKCKTGADE